MAFDPISAGILGGVQLFSTLGEALFGQARAERQAIQNAIAQQGQAQSKAFAEQAQKGAQSLSQLIEAYRSSLMG